VNLHVSTRGHWTLEWPGLPAMHCPSQHQQTTGNDQLPATRTTIRVHRSERHHQSRRKCDPDKDSNSSPITANVVSADCPIPVPFRSPW
jgi:hypothetical protein